jgi:predicted ATP-dependent endonuclease of OLD family
MNEQLIVKNFGPIKDATVDFKRVTVFIGPTGGGKSTLAKLAAVFRDGTFFLDDFHDRSRSSFFKKFLLSDYFLDSSFFQWKTSDGDIVTTDNTLKFNNKAIRERGRIRYMKELENPSSKINKLLEGFKSYIDSLPEDSPFKNTGIGGVPMQGATSIPISLMQSQEIEKLMHGPNAASSPTYIPSERILASAIEYAWAGLISEKIGLPAILIDFINALLNAKRDIKNINIKFLDVTYSNQDGKDFIQATAEGKLLRLYETASGIQSVTPLLVLLEHLSRNTEQAQSFIIEEPELNLYPTAQQGLLNWLVEKCTQGENDLTITTHSPYILSHLNLLLYAYQVAEKHPERAEEVAELVPRASWINPKEFACYQVENGGVTSLVNAELGLIDDNGLDNLSGDAADAFDNLIRLSKGVARK